MSIYFRFTITVDEKSGKARVNAEEFHGINYSDVPLYSAASKSSAQSFINRFTRIHKVDHYFVDIKNDN